MTLFVIEGGEWLLINVPWAGLFAVGFVTATTMTTSAIQPLVMNTLLPFKIQSSPSFFALVRTPCKSLESILMDTYKTYKIYNINVYFLRQKCSIPFHLRMFTRSDHKVITFLYASGFMKLNFCTSIYSWSHESCFILYDETWAFK